jgi:hypothetical protein
MNARLSGKVIFHQVVQGCVSWTGKEAGTAILEAKLQMKNAMRTINHGVLRLRKAYDTLERVKTIALLKGYGVRNNILNCRETF